MPLNRRRIATEEESAKRQLALGGTPSPSLPLAGPKTPDRNPTPLSFITANVLQPSPGNPVQFPQIVIPYGYSLLIKAMHSNKGNVYLGNSQTNAKVSVGNAFPLLADQAWNISIQNANAVWFDTDNAGEGVSLAVEQ